MQKYGIMIMSGFAALWFVWGLSAIGPINRAWLIVPLAISGTMIAAASRIEVHAPAETRRIVGWASGIEGVAIFAATNVLNNLGYPGYAVSATLAIVGLHFLPLAYYLQVRTYYVSGAALVALAAAGLAIDSDATRLLVTGVGAASLLWITCLVAFARKTPAALAAA
jgi:hypothetical protein